MLVAFHISFCPLYHPVAPATMSIDLSSAHTSADILTILRTLQHQHHNTADPLSLTSPAFARFLDTTPLTPPLLLPPLHHCTLSLSHLIRLQHCSAG